MDARIDGADVKPEVASLKTMHDRYPTSGKNVTKVGKRIRNGSHWSCVGEDQNDFGFVKQASIGTSKMDHGMESNDGQEMDQEWNQVFEMLEQVGLTNKANGILKHSHERIPSGMLACSKAPPNLINHAGSVRSAYSIIRSRKPSNHIIIRQKVMSQRITIMKRMSEISI